MQVKTLVKKLSLSLSPLEAYKRLSDNGRKPNTVLLETAEAVSHKHQKSIIGISSAVEVKAKDSKVIINALNNNGRAFIASFDSSELNGFEITSSEDSIELRLRQERSSYDEEKRLSQISTLFVLKEIKRQIKCNSAEDETSYLLGAFSYDLVDQFEALKEIEKPEDDFVFYLADQLLIQTRDNNSAQIIIKGFGQNACNEIHLGLEMENVQTLINSPMAYQYKQIESSNVNVDVSDEKFMQQVKDAKEHIIKGDVFQVVLSRNYSIDCPEPLLAYENLRSSNPSPYMYFLNFADKQLFGASPESCLKLNSDKQISLYPIAGTRKRPIIDNRINHARDALIEFELLDDAKESAEHMMLVDLARNDIARVAKNGTRKITQLKKIVKYSHVMHMVSEIKGTLKDTLDPLDAYRACANMGTLTGTPKIKAANIIRDFEQHGRGFYGGAVTAFNANDEFDSAIVIRSAVIKESVATITAGAGIVYESNPSAEAKETDNKAAAVISACQAALLVKEKVA